MNEFAFVDKSRELELPGKENVVIVIVSPSDSAANLRPDEKKSTFFSFLILPTVSTAELKVVSTFKLHIQ